MCVCLTTSYLSVADRSANEHNKIMFLFIFLCCYFLFCFYYISQDTIAPDIICPYFSPFEATSNAGKAVLYDLPNADDVSAVNVICDPPSNSVFAIRDTLVYCTATDDADNNSTCNFTITVEGFFFFE